MLYREAGQFKTDYASDQAIFPILQDRIGLVFVKYIHGNVAGVSRRNAEDVSGIFRIKQDQIMGDHARPGIQNSRNFDNQGIRTA